MNKQMKILLSLVPTICLFCINTYSADYSGTDIVGIETIVNDISTPSDETWRLEANQRIDQHRKADMNIFVVDQATGLAIPGVQVDVKLIRHKFRFGTITEGAAITGNEPTIDGQLYKDTFLNMGFNAAGNTALKQKYTRLHGYLPEIKQWFADNHIPMRGHHLIWPSNSHLEPLSRAALDLYDLDPSEANKQNLRDTIESQMIDWASAHDVVYWHVINESRGNHEIMDIFGDEIMIDWFNIAQQYSVNPNVKLLLNENRIISDPAAGITTNFINRYIATVRYLLDNGAPLSGFGFQSRFRTMMSADTIYQRLQLFEEFDLPIAATEFEMKPEIGTELDKAIMTERVMTTYFSHYLVDEMYAFSFFPNSDNREVVDSAGMPNLRGKVWLYLMKNHWMTDESLASNQNGHAYVRAFKGDYDITVQDGKETKTIQVTLDSNSTFTIPVSKTPPPIAFEPTDDAHVRGTATSNNYGSKEVLELRSITGNWPRAAYLKFTVSDLNGDVDSAILNLYSNTQVGGVDAFAVADTTWSEDAITWDTRPVTGSVIASGNADANAWFQIDISSYITGNGTYAIALETPVNSSMGELSSKEGANPPVLNVTVAAVDWCQVANLNGVMPIDMNDFAMMASNWQLNGTNLPGDINKDRHVNAIDLKIVASYWLSDCGQE